MTALKVGDICVGQNLLYDTKGNGMLCEVIGGEEYFMCYPIGGGLPYEELCYEVKWADGAVTAQTRHELRKIDPPSAADAASRQAMLDCIERAQKAAQPQAELVGVA